MEIRGNRSNSGSIEKSQTSESKLLLLLLLRKIRKALSCTKNNRM